MQVAFVFITILLLAACADSPKDIPQVPTVDEVREDIQRKASDIFLGKIEDNDELINLSNVIIDDEEMTFSIEKDTAAAEVIAFVGDQDWRSEHKITIIIHYELTNDKQWTVKGMDIGDPVINVIPRKVVTVTTAA